MEEQQEQGAAVVLETENTGFDESFIEAVGDSVVTTPVVVEETPVASEETPVVATSLKTGDAPTETSTPDYKVLFEAEQQRTRSWEGRLSAAERRNAELQAQIQTPVSTKQDTPVSTESLVDADDPLIQSFIKEMGADFIKPLDAYMKKQLKPIIEELIKPFVDRVPVIEQRVAANDEVRVQEHFGKIYSAHSDVEDLVKPDPVTNQSALDVYVESLPYAEAVSKKKIMQDGTTQQVIDLLTEFKKKTGKVVPPVIETPQPKPNALVNASKDEIVAATAVKGKVSIIPKGKAAINDFAGAFSEAVGA
jgi:hypothetical protein